MLHAGWQRGRRATCLHPYRPAGRCKGLHSSGTEAGMTEANFNWALVKSFIAVLDAGSLMGAARKLGAQQPTLSRHVAELEAQLGMPLFERTGRGFTPTSAALAIADAARQMHGGAATL